MNKLLSICIPSYNMESFLHRCVDSLLIPSLDKLEIIIVNDGSRDRTLEIARAYQQAYPGSVVVVDKANGHYGSTVNAALKIATGKYFRILDADDWFDTKALEALVHKLDDCEADCVFTNFVVHDLSKEQVVSIQERLVTYEKVIPLRQNLIPINGFNMHQLTYRLSFLKAIQYVQTEGVCYTDTEYIFYPLSQAETFVAFDLSLYQYFLGREEQSMSLSSLKKNISHRWPIVHRMLADKGYLHGNRMAAGLRSSMLQSLIGSIYEMYICYGDYASDYDAELRAFLRRIKQEEPETYAKMLTLNRHEVIFYVRFWLWFGRLSFPLCHLLFRLREGSGWNKA